MKIGLKKQPKNVKVKRMSAPQSHAGIKSDSPPLKHIVLRVLAPGARQVHVAGDFNQWNTLSHQLSSDGCGRWCITLTLPPGRYEYRFISDGQWMDAKGSTQKVPNIYGGMNSVIDVSD